MNTYTQNNIKNYTENIAEYKKSLEQATAIHNALLLHTGKQVNSSFFEKYFLIPSDTPRHDGKAWTSMNIRKNDNTWGKPYRLYGIGKYPIDLDSRDTSHIISVIADNIKTFNANIQSQEDNITALQGFNEDALIKDLQDLYEKYNGPSVWLDVLQDYKVKYPNN